MSQNDIGGRINSERIGSGDRTTDAQVNEIQADIAQTRSKMSETINELQERLSPAHLKEQLKDQVREQYEHAKQTVRGATIGKVEDMVYETRRTIVDTITSNPVPSALIGIGLAWLWMNTRSDSPPAGGRYGQRSQGPARYDDREYDYDYGTAGTYPSAGRADTGRERGRGSNRSGSSGATWAQTAGEAVSSATGRIQESASNLASRAKDTVTGAVGQAQATAGEWVGQAQQQAHRVEERLQATMHESPLALGAVALALGTAVGLAVPPTRKENEWMGEARDRLLDRAQSVAHETIDQVQGAAQKVTDEMAGGRGRPGSQGT